MLSSCRSPHKSGSHCCSSASHLRSTDSFSTLAQQVGSASYTRDAFYLQIAETRHTCLRWAVSISRYRRKQPHAGHSLHVSQASNFISAGRMVARSVDYRIFTSAGIGSERPDKSHDPSTYFALRTVVAQTMATPAGSTMAWAIISHSQIQGMEAKAAPICSDGFCR